MKIPVYESPEVEPGAMPEARLHVETTASNFGGQLAQPVDSLVSGLGEIYHKEKQKADAAATTDAENEFQKATNNRLYDPANGVMNKRGEDAVAASQDVYGSLEKERQNIADKLLTNDDQRRMFLLRTGGVLETTHRTVEEHVGQQIHAANQASVRGLQETSLQALANNYADPVARATYTAQPEGPTAAQALSPDDAAGQLAEWRQRAASTVMNQYLDHQDAKGAQDYFAQSKDVLGTASAQFEQRLLALSNQLEGGKQASTILKSSLGPTGQPDLGKVFVALENMPEGKLKDDTRKELAPRLSMAEAAFNEDEKQRLGRVVQGVEKTNGFLDQSSADYTNLTDDNKAKALERAKTIQHQVRGFNAEERRQQHEADRAATTGANAMDDQDLVKIDPAQAFPGASQPALNAIKSLQKKAEGRIQRGDSPKMAEFKSNIAAVSETLGFTGNPAQKQLGADLMAIMTQWREKQIEKNGDTPPTRKEIDKKLADELTHSPSHWYSTGGYRFQSEKTGDTFEPGPPEDQKYAPAKAAMTVPASAPAPAVPAAPIRKTKGNRTFEKRGGQWVEVGGG